MLAYKNIYEATLSMYNIIKTVSNSETNTNYFKEQLISPNVITPGFTILNAHLDTYSKLKVYAEVVTSQVSVTLISTKAGYTRVFHLVD